jgi:malate dehydrogenase (quinone)
MKREKYTLIDCDALLIGTGVMSGTLGTLLKELDPSLNIKIVERLESPSLESSDGINNAGTGHAGYCELNYTPELNNGSIDIAKAVKVSESFEQSKQLWSYLVSKNVIQSNFITSVPHISFVKGKKDVEFLKKRYNALIKNPLFQDMKYTEDLEQIRKWAPLVANGQDSMPMAATKMKSGTDIDFGALTRGLIAYLQSQGVEVNYNFEVYDLYQQDAFWFVCVNDLKNDKKIKFKCKFVFIGAGGFALTLLEKSGIKEANGYGGFPISGQWLVCKNQDVVKQHNAKVYGKAEEGSPPMSVPHLDTREINGEKSLLFGPYATFTTKFLKKGSNMDLPSSINTGNLFPMLSAGAKNIPLTKYLIKELAKSDKQKFKTLLNFYPEAKIEDWTIEDAGQRVQVIKKDKSGKGIIEFGTEIVSSADGTVAALLGASPGASTSVSIMLDLIEKCFKDKVDFNKWTNKIEEMIPSYKKSLSDDKYLFYNIETKTSAVLGLNGREKLIFS